MNILTALIQRWEGLKMALSKPEIIAVCQQAVQVPQLKQDKTLLQGEVSRLTTQTTAQLAELENLRPLAPLADPEVIEALEQAVASLPR